jgi:7-cyano-7-deazaguanine synthase
LTTAELVRRASVDLSLLGWTHSCHVANEPCGMCRGCGKRYVALRDAALW